MTTVMSLGDLLGAVPKGGCTCPSCKPLKPADVEVAVMELRAAFERFTQPCPFQPGDLVTPMKNSGIKCAGEPHIVLEVLKTPIVMTTVSEPDDTSSNTFGARLDFRVAKYIRHGENDDAIVAHVSESWLYEPYRAPEAK